MDRLLIKRIFFICLATLIFIVCFNPAYSSDVRKPILAGTWYPRDKTTLIKSIQDFLSKTDIKGINGRLKAIVVPHAGYQYSGQIAAHAYRMLQGMDIQHVIMIGPSHRMGFRGVSVNMQAGYETPIGMVPVDLTLVRQLMKTHKIFRNIPEAHSQEHSLEIQLPFLQVVLSDFKMVPIIMGEQDFNTCKALAEVLATIIDPLQKTLILASSDLSHFHSDKEARELDMEFARHVRAMDPKGLRECLSSGTCEACGGGPVITALLAAKKLGADQANILCYGHSGEITGDNRRVVGYLSAAFFQSQGYH
ncbi:MAG: AmmeMemoRadiSam system protein B [Deltaproteobacteria bacterium]|nr:AmmeMemoRadiSam system protein B [Deltaproteobacteria bacterium]